MSGDGVLDPEIVAELFRAQADYGNPTFIRRLVELFSDNAPRRMAQIREALGVRDASMLERAAHTLKSNCGMLGASRMADCCASLEDAGARAAFEDAGRVFTEAELEFPRVLAAVQRLADVTPDVEGDPGS